MPTPEHPPPAPDWILGEDGHWKPPPFGATGSARPTGPAAPDATGPVPPPQGWTAVGPPPGPPPRSEAATVVRVVGGLALAGVLGVGVLLFAVTMLGRSAEPRFSVVGDGSSADGAFVRISPDDAGGDGAADGALGGDGDVSDSAPSEMAALLSSEAIVVPGADWTVSQMDLVEPQAGVGSGECMPEGWLTGARDRFRVHLGRPSTGNPQALVLSFTTYETEALAVEEMGRVGGEVYRTCEVEERLAEVTGPASGATVTPLPWDATAPGVIFRIDLVGASDPLTTHEFNLFVGRQRAHLGFCGCLDLPYEDQLAIARQVAGAMAEAQGLPAPG